MKYTLSFIFIVISYLSFSQNKIENAKDDRSKLITTAPSGLTIRDKPSISSNKIGKLIYEDVVDVIEETNEALELEDGKNLISGNWIKIKIPKTNKEGYVFGGYLNALNDKLPSANHYLKYRLNYLMLSKTPVKDTIPYEYKKPSYILNKKEWQELGFNDLEEFNDEPYITHSIYNVEKTKYGFVFFVERYHDNEAYHWLCLVDYNFKLKDHITIAYDNAEGFTGTQTRFKQEKIIVDYYNIYETPEEKSTTFKIENLKFKTL